MLNNHPLITNHPIGFALPEGNRTGPNCGVTAVAIVTGLPFNNIWNRIKSKYKGNWKGRTKPMDWFQVLEEQGINHEVSVVPSTPQLLFWARAYAKKDTAYMVMTTGHVQVVKNGWVIDQGGPKPVRDHWGRRKKVKLIVELKEGSNV